MSEGDANATVPDAALAVGIQFAVVTYAGVALGEGRRDESEPAAA